MTASNPIRRSLTASHLTCGTTKSLKNIGDISESETSHGDQWQPQTSKAWQTTSHRRQLWHPEISHAGSMTASNLIIMTTRTWHGRKPKIGYSHTPYMVNQNCPTSGHIWTGTSDTLFGLHHWFLTAHTQTQARTHSAVLELKVHRYNIYQSGRGDYWRRFGSHSRTRTPGVSENFLRGM
jgi:hypothetical protein